MKFELRSGVLILAVAVLVPLWGCGGGKSIQTDSFGNVVGANVRYEGMLGLRGLLAAEEARDPVAATDEGAGHFGLGGRGGDSDDRYGRRNRDVRHLDDRVRTTNAR